MSEGACRTSRKHQSCRFKEPTSLLLSAREPLLFQRYLNVKAGLVSHHAGDMSAAREVVRQHDIARAEAFLRAVADLDLGAAGKGDHVLTPRRRMPVLNLAGRADAEQDALSGLEFFRLD